MIKIQNGKKRNHISKKLCYILVIGMIFQGINLFLSDFEQKSNTFETTDKIGFKNGLKGLQTSSISDEKITPITASAKIKNQLDDGGRDCYALLCGVSDYIGTDIDLRFCDDDVIDVELKLKTEFGIPDANIETLIDASANEADIKSAIASYADIVDEEDTFLFYYSGHGTCDTSTQSESTTIESPHPYTSYYDHYWYVEKPSAMAIRVRFQRIDVESGYDVVYVGDGYNTAYMVDYFSGSYDYVWSNWVVSDKLYIELLTDSTEIDWGFEIDRIEWMTPTAPYGLVPYCDSSSDTMLTGSEIATAATYIPGQQIYIFDSCFSGGVGSSLSSSADLVLCASESDESSLEDEGRSNGVFTWEWMNSWDTASDSDGDDIISFEESFSKTRTDTISRSTTIGYTHHPIQYDADPANPLLFHPKVENSEILSEDNYKIKVQADILGLGESSITAILTDMESQLQETYVWNDLELNNTFTNSWELDISNITGYDSFDYINLIIHQNYYGNDASESIFLTKNDSSSYYSLIDSDMDGLNDYEEIMLSLNPWDGDCDDDGLTDGFEISLSTSPMNPDTDGDGIPDGYEVINTLDPLDADDASDDLDNDNLTNLEEYQYGTDVDDTDTDNDDVPDNIEIFLESNPLIIDSDDDGLTDGMEYGLGSDLTANDSDNDGLDDLFEFNWSTDLSDGDSDNDDLNDRDEYIHGTDPLNSDTDGDGFSDGEEIAANTNPLKPISNPNTPKWIAGISIGVASIGALSIPIGKHIKSGGKKGWYPGKTMVKNTKERNAQNEIRRQNRINSYRNQYNSPHNEISRPSPTQTYKTNSPYSTPNDIPKNSPYSRPSSGYSPYPQPSVNPINTPNRIPDAIANKMVQLIKMGVCPLCGSALVNLRCNKCGFELKRK